MAEISGAAWVARFPTSHSPDDLVEPFRSKAKAFVAALEAGGVRVSWNATYRPVERAYLMHWCWFIAREGFDPRAVPPMAGVDIDWTHGGDDAAAGDAAEAMVIAYGIAYEPALQSRHTQRFAMDLNISWAGPLNVVDANGVRHNVMTDPRDTTNAVIVEIARTFGVIKNPKDRPHFSVDGR